MERQSDALVLTDFFLFGFIFSGPRTQGGGGGGMVQRLEALGKLSTSPQSSSPTSGVIDRSYFLLSLPPRPQPRGRLQAPRFRIDDTC